MPNKFTNHIVSINDELYKYLNDVKNMFQSIFHII